MVENRTGRVGQSVDDLCRACKCIRSHTVMAVGPRGEVLRVICDFCGSQHNDRGGREPRSRAGGARPEPRAPTEAATPFPAASERERSPRAMDDAQREGTPRPAEDLESAVRRVMREELGWSAVIPADKWRGGDLVLRPGREGLQEKSWPIETFFNKIVMLRNRLRVLEQQVNGSDLSDEAKLKLQGYITACYGSLTSFNVLFADDEDRFRGAGGKE